MRLILLFTTLLTLNSFAQETDRMVQYLHNEVEKELKNQFNNQSFAGDTLVVIQSFTIYDSVMVYETKHNFYYGNGYQIERQEVILGKITGIAKDVQILFETQPFAVKTIQTNYYDDGRIETKTDQRDLFFTYLKSARNNEGFGYDIVRLFKKVGYTIQISHWYD